jgi:hypothetical protein
MKVYTYYDQIPGLPCQTDLIDLWKKSWSSRGYDPVVLNDTDARKHPRYEQFCSYITELHKEIKQEPIQKYGLSCYLRWLSYATTDDPACITSDYDVLNFNLNTSMFDTKNIHLMAAGTPCLVAGSADLFDRFSQMFIDTMIEHVDVWRGTFKDNVWLNDQEFLARCLYTGEKSTRQKFVEKYNLNVNYDWGKFCENYKGIQTKQKHPCVHYAHHALHEYMPILRGDQSMNTIKLFEKFLQDYNIGFENGHFTQIPKLTQLQFNKEIDWTCNYQENIHRFRLLVMYLDLHNV